MTTPERPAQTTARPDAATLAAPPVATPAAAAPVNTQSTKANTADPSKKLAPGLMPKLQSASGISKGAGSDTPQTRSDAKKAEAQAPPAFFPPGDSGGRPLAPPGFGPGIDGMVRTGQQSPPAEPSESGAREPATPPAGSPTQRFSGDIPNFSAPAPPPPPVTGALPLSGAPAGQSR